MISSKAQLEKLSFDELKKLTRELGMRVKHGSTPESLIYAIMDKQAEMQAMAQQQQAAQQMDAIEKGSKAAKNYADAETISGGMVEELLG